MQIKICSVCKTEKNTLEFHKSKTGKYGVRADCIICHRIINKARYYKNNNKILQRNRRLKLVYGISHVTYTKILNQQNNKCAICLREETFKLKGNTIKLAVDHCHDTGKIRGLLCLFCNRGIGLLKEDVSILNNAIKYLEKHK